MLLTPEYLFRDVTAIAPDFLLSKGVRALVLDVDNTLTAHGSQKLAPEVAAWLETMKKAGIQLMIASNNTRKRVEPFAARIGLDFVSMSCKPFTFGLSRARRKFGVRRDQMAIVGDQLFTDRLAGSIFGITAFVVEPCGKELNWGVKFKRILEKPFMDRYYKRGGKLL